MVIESMPDKEPRILSGRLREIHTSMTLVAEGAKARAEARA